MKLKVRAWEPEEKRWLDVTGIHFSISGNTWAVYEGDKCYRVEIQFWTGFNDTNGKEIYEGDICKWQTYINDNDIDEQIIEPIVFKLGSFTFHDFALVESMPEAIEGSTIEIIGNNKEISEEENPELLNK